MIDCKLMVVTYSDLSIDAETSEKRDLRVTLGRFGFIEAAVDLVKFKILNSTFYEPHRDDVRGNAEGWGNKEMVSRHRRRGGHCPTRFVETVYIYCNIIAQRGWKSSTSPRNNARTDWSGNGYAALCVNNTYNYV